MLIIKNLFFNRKRRKKWTGSISGALSHNSPKYFTSGQELFDETGWWKLTHANKTPKYIFNMCKFNLYKKNFYLIIFL